MKKHGCSLPLDSHQVLSWILLVLNIVLLVITYIELDLPDYQQVIFWIIVTSTLVLIVMTSIATLSESSDSAYIESSEECGIHYHCTACNLDVSKNAKHCGKCDRCVIDFDHHCIWINNCVCKKNYKTFIATLISLEVTTILNLLFDLSLLIEFSDSLMNVLGLSILIEILLFCLIFMGATWLLAFHTYLVQKGITTYEFITSKSSKVAVAIDNDLRQDSEESYFEDCRSEEVRNDHVTEGREERNYKTLDIKHLK